MRVTLFKMRKPDQVKQAVAMMTQLAGARQSGQSIPNAPPGPAS